MVWNRKPNSEKNSAVSRELFVHHREHHMMNTRCSSRLVRGFDHKKTLQVYSFAEPSSILLLILQEECEGGAEPKDGIG